MFFYVQQVYFKVIQARVYLSVSALVGTVTDKIVKDGIEKTEAFEILWTTNGNAMNNPPAIYDLVVELPIAELGN